MQTSVPAPSAADIRATLARVVGSADFRTSPQLVAFLRVIVEMTLSGDSDRIKAYTIGTVALGRGQDFDPQRDPIVRVEANRLRHALAAYYVGDGADDPIHIDIPAGRYVPHFRRRTGEVVPAAPRIRLAMPSPRLVTAAVIAAFVLLVALAAIQGVSLLSPRAAEPTLIPAPSLAGAPLVRLEPIHPVPASAAPLAASLDRELAQAVLPFPNVHVVVTAPAAAPGSDDAPPETSQAYRLTGLVEAGPDGGATVMLQLVTDGVIAWTRDWRLAPDGRPGLRAISREATTDLFAVFGVLHARLRARSADLSPGFRCQLAAADYLRKLEMAEHERVRNCLEQTVEGDPRAAIGWALLALVYEREYLIGLAPRPGELMPPLQRSRQAAARALAAGPGIAVVQVAEMDSHYLVGDLTSAQAAGERALAINPLDPAIAGAVGLRRVLSGDIRSGAPLLERAASHYAVNPTWLDFGLFCVAYLKGDMTTAAHHANLQTSNSFPFGMVARALAAAATGDRAGAQRTLVRLTALYPGWRDPKSMLARFIRSPEIVDRLAADIAALTRS